MEESDFQLLLSRQRELEDQSLAKGAERFRQRLALANSTGKGSTVGGAKRLLAEAIAPLEAAIEEMIVPKRGRPHLAAKWCKAVGPDVAAFITTRVVLDSLSRAVSVRHTAAAITALLLDELRYRRFQEQAPNLFDYRMGKFTTSSYAHMSRSMNAAISYADVDVSDLTMNPSTALVIGSHLIGLLVSATGIISVENVVTKTSGKNRKLAVRTESFIKATADTLEWLDTRNSALEFLQPVKLPMVLPPIPWGPSQRGGYRFALRGKFALKRQRSAKHIRDEARVMPSVYTAVNRIQETAWKINPHVLSLVQEIATQGGVIAGLPATVPTCLPPKPHDIATNALAKQAWKKAAGKVHDQNHARKLKALEFHTTLSTAKTVSDEKAFFFPCNLDFRGRIYPIPNYLSPQGDDLSKALLTFAVGKAVGADGAVWLATHGANCLGKTPEGLKLSTCTLQERVDWITNRTLDIEAVVADPFGNQWWAAADEPLQFYAFCVEWSAYARMQRAGNGDEFVCSLPVAMDGTCNGLQHFAAMLRDDVGGAAVNVTANARPQDIYARIAEMVLKRLEADATDSTFARLWLNSGVVDRKLTKRPTMTFGYGSAKFGFQKQLIEYMKGHEQWKELKEQFTEVDSEGVARVVVPGACGYMAGLIWDSLEILVVAAFLGRAWMQEAARLVTKSGKCVEWTVPLTNFHVRQEYMQLQRSRVETLLAGKVFRPSVYTETDDINSVKQANAVAPNFIHSLDAAALMLTVEAAAVEGVEFFGMIHDSYATLAADAGIMAVCTRQAFVRLYSGDVIEDFSTQLKAQIEDEEVLKKFPATPPRGTLDLNQVLVSDYFFS